MQMLIYTLEFLLNGETRSLAICPVDAANGVILEAPENSKFYRGQTASGNKFQVPIAAVTNVFASYWKVSVNNGQGHKSFHLDDDAMEDYATSDNAQFNKNGALQDQSGNEVTGTDKKPEHNVVRRPKQ